jgi:hypothetical protein
MKKVILLNDDDKVLDLGESPIENYAGLDDNEKRREST